MSRAILALAICAYFLGAALPGETGRALAAEVLAGESEIKFALYSPTWGENTNDSIRLLAHNQSGQDIRLERIIFHNEDESGDTTLRADLLIAAAGYADAVLDYVDLLGSDECVERTLEGNWKLAEISNYTLNPSVRNLIIEDTDSFRIYQCVQTVTTIWTNLADGSSNSHEEWVLFHFESRGN